MTLLHDLARSLSNCGKRCTSACWVRLPPPRSALRRASLEWSDRGKPDTTDGEEGVRLEPDTTAAATIAPLNMIVSKRRISSTYPFELLSTAPTALPRLPYPPTV